MNQASNETAGPGLSLPPPEQLPAPVETGASGQPEQAVAAPERSSQAGQAAPAALPAWPSDLPAAPGGVAADDVSATSGSTAAPVLDDSDLIDKAVVEKAKAIVARTSDDPYRQTEEISGLKAEFLQKNYNKVIKLSK